AAAFETLGRQCGGDAVRQRFDFPVGQAFAAEPEADAIRMAPRTLVEDVDRAPRIGPGLGPCRFSAISHGAPRSTALPPSTESGRASPLTGAPSGCGA